jgi:hypothetical protein
LIEIEKNRLKKKNPRQRFFQFSSIYQNTNSFLENIPGKQLSDIFFGLFSYHRAWNCSKQARKI